MSQELICVHQWSEFNSYSGLADDPEKNPRMRVCQGLCKVWQTEGDPEPRIVIGRLE